MNIISQSSDSLALHVTKEELELYIKNNNGEKMAMLRIVADAGFDNYPSELSVFEGRDGSIEIFAKSSETVDALVCTSREDTAILLSILAFSGSCEKCSLFYKGGKYYILPDTVATSNSKIQHAVKAVKKEFLNKECLCLCRNNAHIVCAVFSTKRKDKL